MDYQKATRRLKEIDKEVVLLSHIGGVLVWDQESVPPAGLSERGEQMGLIDKKIHQLTSSEEMGELLQFLESQESDLEMGAIVRHYSRLYHKIKKLDSSFVQKFSEITTKAHFEWAQARSKGDFSQYEPILTTIIDMVREKAEAYGYSEDPYDSLLDLFEPGTTTKEVETLFNQMRSDLVEILDLKRGQTENNDTFLYTHYPQDKQELFAKEVLKAMGFEWQRGSTGVATHPYTISLGSDDIRITTRYTEPSVLSPLYSSIHEGGHALYEMGASNEKTRGSCLANSASLGFHESQSRLWENMVGRSRPFWSYFFPRLKELFPTQLEYVDIETFLGAVKRVKPSLIRVDADEVTYGLHIILRFELERLLLSKELTVKELPSAWNEKMEKLLGIRPKNNKEGVLQDIHWSMGELGYFPTYALGNLYGAQIFHTLQEQLDFDSVVSSGDFSPIKEWLERNIYRHGALYMPKELIKKVTGSELKTSYFKEYLHSRYLGEA